MSSKCDGFAESTPLTVCQDTGAFPDLASPTPAPFFIPPVPFDGQSACMSALVLLISLSHVRLLPTPPRPISPALRPFPFLSTVSHRPSSIVELATKTPRPSERRSPESCCSETLGIDKANGHTRTKRRLVTAPSLASIGNWSDGPIQPQKSSNRLRQTPRSRSPYSLPRTWETSKRASNARAVSSSVVRASSVSQTNIGRSTATTPLPQTTNTMTIAVKRACDACHRRKVKCDGVNPCRNCLGSQLSCTYNAIPQKKGPKGSRAKVINELKEKERQTSLSAKVQNRMNGINGAPSSPSLAPTPGLLQSDIVKSCIDFFFAHMYRAMPILDRARLEQQALYMDQTLDTYCLLTSLCAFVLLQPGMTLPNSDPFSLDSMPGGNLVTSTLLVEETVRVRKGYDYMDSPTLNSLCTSYFLYGCHYGLDLQDKAWFHIREATTLIHMIGMNKEQNYLQYDSVEAAKRRRLYWLLFATERYVATPSLSPVFVTDEIPPVRML